MHACCTFTSQCQQQGTPFTIFFLSPGLQGKLQMDSGTDLSPPDHCISSSYRHPGRKREAYSHTKKDRTLKPSRSTFMFTLLTLSLKLLVHWPMTW